MITYRNALPKEHKVLTTFLLDHGANPWNHLPEDGIRETFAAVAQGNGEVLLACDNSTIVGLCIFFYPSALPEKYRQYAKYQSAVYVSEVAVHRDYAGQGIGFELLRQTIAHAQALDAILVLIDRHEENLASAGMMRKAGFAELRTFVDLERRDYGSRKTTVMGYQLR
ncbi:N-acetyltransferase family protein [SAR92 clade bacterium H246]